MTLPDSRARKPKAADKRPKTHPWRVWRGGGNVPDRDPQKVVPFSGRLVRR